VRVHDLVIRGGSVVDGSGRPAHTADVAINDGRIVEIGDDIGGGRRELDADGLLVTPGWVDIHSHYDGQSLWDPLLETSAAHGVTTVVMGNCGVGFAPVKTEDRAWTITLMEGVEDIPATVLDEGLSWQWESFPEYLDALDAAPHAIGIAAQIPHAPLRVFAMGERGIDHEEAPTDDEVRVMARLAAESIEAGALGFSTSRSRNHKASDGRITPTYSAGDAELLGIAEAIGRTGKGVFEMNVENSDVDAELRLMRRICEVSGRPLSVALLQRGGQPSDNYRRVLDGFEQAARDGLALWGQVAPRPTGLLMSAYGRVNPLAGSATFRDVARSGRAGLLPELRRPELREKILSELGGEADALSRFPRAFELADPPRYDQQPSEALTERAAAAGVPVTEVAYDILAAGGIVYVPVSNYVEGDLRAAHEMLVHPRTVPGLSDGGAHCTMIADFDYPTFLLSYWGRDAPADLRLPIESVVKHQCADTAALVGLHDRGVLAPGKRADVNLIELSAVGSTFPTIVDDLPGGGSRLLSRGTGYVKTVVSGEVSFEDGAHNGVMAGALARGGQL
jgi:N-acyl-D-aspartate/D-glutamate deacylase